MTIEDLAEITHEANRLYCRKLGDFSLDQWNLLPQDLRDAIIFTVRLHLEVPAPPPPDSQTGEQRMKYFLFKAIVNVFRESVEAHANSS